MKNKILIQDNALTAARYEMTSLEKNVLYSVMSQIEDKDLPTRCYKVSVSDISEFTGRRVRNDDFKEAIKRLRDRDCIVKDSGGVLHAKFISSAYYDDRGFVEIGIDLRLRPFLFELKKNFTVFGLSAAVSLSSKYSKRMYEMLCQFRATGLLRITVDELKERFCLFNDDKTEKFEKWSSFERYVMKAAQKEINDKADFQFDYSLRKEGRRIVAIDFKFRKTLIISPSVQETQKVSFDQSSDPKQPRTIERLKTYGMSDMQINTVLKKYTILQICKILYELDCNKGNIQNTVAYLCKIFNL